MHEAFSRIDVIRVLVAYTACLFLVIAPATLASTVQPAAVASRNADGANELDVASARESKDGGFGDVLADRPIALLPGALLNDAFDRMFNYPSVRAIEVRIVRGGRASGRKVFDIARRTIEGRDHTIMRFSAPGYLRGFSVLMIEDGAGVNQTWVYQPILGRPRRVSTYQKDDPIFGSDLSYSDLESRNWADYRVSFLDGRSADGREFYRIEAKSQERSKYPRIVVWLEKSLTAIARVEFYRSDEDIAAKVISVELDSLVDVEGLLVPKLMTVTVPGQDWVTEVEFVRTEIKPELTRSTFSTTRLMGRGGGNALFKLADRLARSEAKSRRKIGGDE